MTAYLRSSLNNFLNFDPQDFTQIYQETYNIEVQITILLTQCSFIPNTIIFPFLVYKTHLDKSLCKLWITCAVKTLFTRYIQYDIVSSLLGTINSNKSSASCVDESYKQPVLTIGLYNNAFCMERVTLLVRSTTCDKTADSKQQLIVNSSS